MIHLIDEHIDEEQGKVVNDLWLTVASRASVTSIVHGFPEMLRTRLATRSSPTADSQSCA